MGAIITATDLLRARAQGAMLAYDGRNMLLRATGRVHAVEPMRWLDKVEVPAPACRAAGAGGPMVGAVPTDKAVNCRRCLGHRPKARPPRRARREVRARAQQPTLPGFET
jgi:hypothetical protein